jgi:transketolase
MPLSKEELVRLERTAHELRLLTLDTVTWAGGGHIGGALSSTDILTILYHKYLRIDPRKPNNDERDRFILSKAHAGVGFAPVLANLGYIDVELLKEYNHTGSPLGMHLDSTKVPGVDASTGSLGHGLPMGLGMALGARLRGKSWRTYVLMGDGECNEGSVWEAAMCAAHYHTANLTAIVDRNRCMIDGPTEEVMALEPFTDKWRAFGWNVIETDGHDFPALADSLDRAVSHTDGPTVIIAETQKGRGIDFIAGDYRWHYGSFDAAKTAEARSSLETYYAGRMARIAGNGGARASAREGA